MARMNRFRTYWLVVSIGAVAAGCGDLPAAPHERNPAVPPSIALATTELAFEGVTGQAVPAVQAVNVLAADGPVDGLTASVTYAVTPAAAWLEPALSAPSAPAILAVRAEPGALAPGVHTAVVSVASAADPAIAARRVTITVVVRPARE